MKEIFLIGLGNPSKKFELYFFERCSSSKKPMLCLLFAYFLPGFPNPIKNISFIVYF